MPPSASLLLAASACVLTALGAAAAIIEVPLRVSAVGVLMPPDGFVSVVASERGVVTSVNVRDGERSRAGDVLLTIAGDSDAVSKHERASLRAELELIEGIIERRGDSSIAREAAREDEIRAIRQRIAVASGQFDAHHEMLALLEAKSKRMRPLVEQGYVSLVQAEQDRLSLAEARVAATNLEQQLLALTSELEALEYRRLSERGEATERTAEAEIRREQIARELSGRDRRAIKSVRMPAGGIVARVLVRRHDQVNPGQPVVKVFKRVDQLQAWLYVPSSSARMLAPGQQVELQVDAWPRSVFGSRSASVVAVSRIALRPEEVPVSLNTAGPVFEVRAELSDQTVSGLGREWTLAPGTTVRASIVQRRLRLCHWLLQRLTGATDRFA